MGGTRLIIVLILVFAVGMTLIHMNIFGIGSAFESFGQDAGGTIGAYVTALGPSIIILVAMIYMLIRIIR